MDAKKSHVIDKNLRKIISDSFGKYSKYIIQERALPDIRDGLKPVQRRILFAMFELNLLFDKQFKKSARVVGEVIGKFHPHGDQSIYDALVRMSQPWKLNHPLVEMHGNNGSIDDDPPAAMRYTETRLTEIAQYMLNNIKKDAVKFNLNFDDSEYEPSILPSLIPNLLVNGAKGIASGYATEMPPHNLTEVVNAIIKKIQNPEITIRELSRIVKGPDFPTGGIITDKDKIFEVLKYGKGQIHIKAKYELVNDDVPEIVITEIPFGVIKAKLIQQIDLLRIKHNLTSIKEVRDESDGNGVQINIPIATTDDYHQIINFLLAKTDLKISYNYNNVVIWNKTPYLVSFMDLLNSYIETQNHIQRLIINHDLVKMQNRFEIIEGFMRVSKLSNQIITLIKNSHDSRQGVIKNLMSSFQFTKRQAEAISDLRLYRLSRTDQTSYLEEKEKLQSKINGHQNLLDSTETFDGFLIDKLEELKALFGRKRLTKIINDNEDNSFKMENLFSHINMFVGITRDGYIKGITQKVMNSNTFNTFGIDESDKLIFFKEVNTRHKLLLFTNQGRVVKLDSFKVEISKWRSEGIHLNEYTTLRTDEKIVVVIPLNEFNPDLFVFIASKYGKAKRIPLNLFDSKNGKIPVICISLKDGDELIGATLTNGFMQIILIASNQYYWKYMEVNIPIYSLRASGINAIKLGTNVFLESAHAVTENMHLSILSGKHDFLSLPVTDFRYVSRNSLGKPISKLISQSNFKIDSIITSTSSTKSKKFIVYKMGDELQQIDISEISKKKLSTAQVNFFDERDFNSNFDYTWLIEDAKLNSNPSENFQQLENKVSDASQISLDDLLSKINKKD